MFAAFVFNPPIIVKDPLSDGYASGDYKIHGGTLLDIPQGWVLADGLNGTMDFRDRAICGVGDSWVAGSKFGSKINNVTSATLSKSQIPAHAHQSSRFRISASGGNAKGSNSAQNYAQYTNVSTTSEGGSQSHNHSVSTFQPSIAVIWIMKL
ncbi:hypothetical protein [Aliivibrio kagoshimensis]|uniref:hypothetical protein n=1 Tax=Aliivibrio kagoshimensis TaxID=2910230 RepID=UPI003D12EFE5